MAIRDLADRVIAAVDPSLTIEYVSYAEAYDADFEDCRRRTPDLTRLRETIGFEPEHTLADVIRDVIEWRRD